MYSMLGLFSGGLIRVSKYSRSTRSIFAAIFSGIPTVNALFRGDAAQKCQVLSGTIPQTQGAGGQAVVNVADPVGKGQRFALRSRDRDHRHVRILVIKGREITHVQPSMQGREFPNPSDARDREMETDSWGMN